MTTNEYDPDIYVCDPAKARDCLRTHCASIGAGRCSSTARPDRAERNHNGEPLRNYNISPWRDNSPPPVRETLQTYRDQYDDSGGCAEEDDDTPEDTEDYYVPAPWVPGPGTADKEEFRPWQPLDMREDPP